MAPLVGAARLPSRGRWPQGSVEPLLARAAGSRRGPVEWGRARGMGDPGMPVVLSQGVGTPARQTPAELRVLSATPFGRGKGSGKDRRKPAETGRASRCPSEPGWQKGAPRRTLGSGNAPRRLARPLSILPRCLSAFLRPPPARLAASGGGPGPGKFVATSPSREPPGRRGAQVGAGSLKAAALGVGSPRWLS